MKYHYPAPAWRHAFNLREQGQLQILHQPEECSLGELIAAIVGGTRREERTQALLSRIRTKAALLDLSAEEITAVTGIGQQTAMRLKAAVELGRRLLEPDEPEPRILSPEDAAKLLLPILGHLDQEYLLVILLNTRKRVMGIVELYHGCLNRSYVRVAEVFREAIRRNADSILLAHNHPSGDRSPSPDDLAVTREVTRAGEMLEIEVVDHLIITRNGFSSLRSHGQSGASHEH